MALPNITFTKGQGGLGRTPANEDHISGIVFYDNTKPSGFTSGTSYVQKVLSIVDAENYGIVRDYSDETASTAEIQVTTSGASGDEMVIAVTNFEGTTNLGTYESEAPGSVSDEATAIATFINNNTFSHGYTATASTDTVTITAPEGKGLSLEQTGAEITATITGTLEVDITQFSGGVYSKLALYHYQISEFFRMNLNATLWVKFADADDENWATQLNDLQSAAEGKIRQVGLYSTFLTGVTTSKISAVDNAVATLQQNWENEISVLMTSDITSVANLSNLPDLSTLLANTVSYVIGQSFSGEGEKLYYNSGKISVPALGTALGTVSLANVNEDIAWVAAFNVSDGIENETVGFGNGDLFNNTQVSLQNQLNGFRYIFLRKFIGTTGSFWNDSHVAVSTTSDYAYIENNRTIAKAIRQVRTALTPYLNSPIALNADGTISDVTIAALGGSSDFALEQMLRNAEISAYSTSISPSQNVLATSKIEVVINIVPQGVAREIAVTIGFTTSI